ncbi:MAG: DMT family transporter [Bacteroidia bacterium]
MKEGLKAYDQWQLAALRITIAGLFLLPFIRWRNVKIPRKDFKIFALSGLLGNTIPAFLFTIAQTKLSSSMSGALNSLTPIFVLIVGLVFMGVSFNRYKLYGVILGLTGALTLIFSQGFIITDNEMGHSIYVVIAALCYGTNVNIIKYKLGHYPPFLVAALPLAMMAVITTVILLFIGLPSNALSVEIWRPSIAVVVLAVFGTSLSLIWFNKLIQATNAVFASSVTYLIPIVALFWGLIDGEKINLIQIIGLAIILLAIWIVNKTVK